MLNSRAPATAYRNSAHGLCIRSILLSGAQVQEAPHDLNYPSVRLAAIPSSPIIAPTARSGRECGNRGARQRTKSEGRNAKERQDEPAAPLKQSLNWRPNYPSRWNSQNRPPASKIDAGSVKTQARSRLRTVDHCKPEWFAAIVP